MNEMAVGKEPFAVGMEKRNPFMKNIQVLEQFIPLFRQGRSGIIQLVIDFFDLLADGFQFVVGESRFVLNLFAGCRFHREVF